MILKKGGSCKSFYVSKKSILLLIIISIIINIYLIVSPTVPANQSKTIRERWRCMASKKRTESQISSKEIVDAPERSTNSSSAPYAVHNYCRPSSRRKQHYSSCRNHSSTARWNKRRISQPCKYPLNQP